MTTYCLHFSPCGSIKSYAMEMADAIDSSYVSFDLTRSDLSIPVLKKDDIIVVAVPVYGGRVPKVFAERLSRRKGCCNKAISAVVYDNRAYDDALLELNDILLPMEMIPVASGAFLARHVLHPFL